MNRRQRFLSALNLHIAGAVILAAVVLVLGTKALLALHSAAAVQSDSYQQQAVASIRLQGQMARVQDLPQMVNDARDQQQSFYSERVAPNYSTMIEQLYAPAIANQVRLTRAQYTPSPPVGALMEVRIDAALSGDYVPMVHFINDLERDKNHVFFIIDGLAFTGQQGGLVNLRLRLTTYLAASATDLPPTLPAPDASPRPDYVAPARAPEGN
jgi:type IV pilus assembly protein PilO